MSLILKIKGNDPIDRALRHDIRFPLLKVYFQCHSISFSKFFLTVEPPAVSSRARAI